MLRECRERLLHLSSLAVGRGLRCLSRGGYPFHASHPSLPSGFGVRADDRVSSRCSQTRRVLPQCTTSLPWQLRYPPLAAPSTLPPKPRRSWPSRRVGWSVRAVASASFVSVPWVTTVIRAKGTTKLWLGTDESVSALLPGTIANDFRTKTAVAETGGRDETKLPIRHSWEKLLLQPEQGGHGRFLAQIDICPRGHGPPPHPPFSHPHPPPVLVL